jgi:WD40 repeat protein
MAVRKYVEETTIHGHSASITVVSFSPDGRYLASASEDGVILVFSTASWRAKQRYADVSPVSALTWHPTFSNTIICGCKNGDIVTLCFDHDDRVLPILLLGAGSY